MTTTKGKPGDWMKSEPWLANVGHVLGGYGAILTAWTLTHVTWHIIATWCAGTAAALVKEYIIDLREESDETVLSSTVDFVGYVAGAGVATGLIEIARALGA